MGKLQVIVGGQAGSEGKGAVAACLARHAAESRTPLAAVRVAGPNAGHSACAPDGTKWALRQIPVAAVVNPDAKLYITAGSEIDIDVLTAEITRLEEGGHKIRERLTIDPMATIVEARHKEAEAAHGIVGRIGSTGKGIGAARAERIWRTATIARDTDLDDLCAVAPVAPRLRDALSDGVTAQVEGTQGHWLGLHHEFYPQVTSSGTRAVDFLAMAGISPWDIAITDFEVWAVFRTRPIRVAGASGPLPGETNWEELGLDPEYTTVTGKLRRVGEWDAERATTAVRDNGGAPAVRLAVTMMDQLSPSLAGVTTVDAICGDPTAAAFIRQVEADTGAPVRLVGTSDRTMVAL